jgi:hypothetical protein
MEEVKITYEEPTTITANPSVDSLNIAGFIQTYTTAPTYKPKKLLEQICIVNNAGFKLYVYDTVSNSWKSTTIT